MICAIFTRLVPPDILYLLDLMIDFGLIFAESYLPEDELLVHSSKECLRFGEVRLSEALLAGLEGLWTVIATAAPNVRGGNFDVMQCKGLR